MPDSLFALDTAKSLLGAVTACADPAKNLEHVARIGVPVVACPSIQIGVTNIESSGPANCPELQYTVVAIIGRGCATEFFENGSNNLPVIERNSQQAEADAACLVDVFSGLDPTYTLSFSVTGGMLVSELTATVPAYTMSMIGV